MTIPIVAKKQGKNEERNQLRKAFVPNPIKINPKISLQYSLELSLSNDISSTIKIHLSCAGQKDSNI
jgi:hypothetical protein